MDETTRSMLLIKSLDPHACLLLSEYTSKWYVSARVEISNGSFLTSVTAHRGTPADAVAAFLHESAGGRA